MHIFEEAIQLDVAKEIEAAAMHYEEVILNEAAPLEAFLNLACLYWRSTEYGFNAGMRLSLDFIDLAGIRYTQVLQAGREQLGDLPEIRFWEIYFSYVDLGGPPLVDEVLSLTANNPNLIVPYLHLYGETGDVKYFPKISQLKKEALKLLTTKNRYIVSILGGSLSMHKHDELFRLFELQNQTSHYTQLHYN